MGTARIHEIERRKAHDAYTSLRSSQLGSGDRSERIRTYNFAQDRVTDHRVGLHFNQLEHFLGCADPGPMEQIARACRLQADTAAFEAMLEESRNEVAKEADNSDSGDNGGRS